MTVFLDASALVAMMAEEPESFALREVLAANSTRLTSGIAMWEAARAIARQPETGMTIASSEVERFCTMLSIVVAPIGLNEAAAAWNAHARYGKGTGHPAKLNMGDCFAYACAEANDAKLLYKGNDFIHTDLK